MPVASQIENRRAERNSRTFRSVHTAERRFRGGTRLEPPLEVRDRFHRTRVPKATVRFGSLTANSRFYLLPSCSNFRALSDSFSTMHSRPFSAQASAKPPCEPKPHSSVPKQFFLPVCCSNNSANTALHSSNRRRSLHKGSAQTAMKSPTRSEKVRQSRQKRKRRPKSSPTHDGQDASNGALHGEQAWCESIDPGNSFATIRHIPQQTIA